MNGRTSRVNVVHQALRRLVVASFVGLASIAGAAAQDDPTIYLVSYVEAVPASQRQVATMLSELAAASRGEGAVRFEVVQRTTHPNEFLILEMWKDQQALDRHVSAPHFTKFRDAVAPLLTAPIDERLCVATVVGSSREDRNAVYAVTHVDVPGNVRPDAMRIMTTHTEQSRKEPGNVRFDIVHQKNRTNHFSVIEVWADQRSENQHHLTAQTKEYRKQINPLLGALYDRRVYKAIAAP
jgi:quinol monooxygenase YgiN